MNTTSQSFQGSNLISRGQLLASGIYLTMAGTTATIGNTIVTVTYIIDSKLKKKHQNLLLLNMAVSDLLISVFGYPFATSSCYAGRWLFTDDVCIIYAFFCYMFSMVTVGTLVGLSFFRYIQICKPSFLNIITWRNTYKVIGGAWLYGFFWAICPVVGWSNYTYEEYGTSCSCNWYSSAGIDVSYNISSILLCFFLPLIFLSYFYIKMCMTMVTLFILIWSPYVLFSALGPFVRLPPSLVPLPSMLAKFSPCCNPIVYFLFNKPYKQAIYRVWCRCRHKTRPNNVPGSPPRQRNARLFIVEDATRYSGFGASDSQQDQVSGEVKRDNRQIYDSDTAPEPGISTSRVTVHFDNKAFIPEDADEECIYQEVKIKKSIESEPEGKPVERHLKPRYRKNIDSKKQETVTGSAFTGVKLKPLDINTISFYSRHLNSKKS